MLFGQSKDLVRDICRHQLEWPTPSIGEGIRSKDASQLTFLFIAF